MSEYYYVVAALPLLSFDQEQAQSPDEFLAMCEGHLSPEDFALLCRARLAPSGEPTTVALDFETLLDARALVGAWLNWESRLRDELVRLRSQRLEVEGARYLSDAAYVTGVYDVAREAIAAGSPLEGEQILDRARWRYLDELENGHTFDLARLVVYYLRLQILDRRSRFRREQGERRFSALYSAVIPQSFVEQFGRSGAERGE